MSRHTFARWAGPALIVGGVLWVVARVFVTFPPPLSYDAANRLFTLPLLLLLAGWLGLFVGLRGRVSGLVRGGWLASLVGMALMLIGNAVEFWGVLLQEKPNAYAAASGEEVWAGSDVGWMIFGLGHLLVVIGMAVVGIAGRRGLVFRRSWSVPVGIAILGLVWPILSFTAAGDVAVMAATGITWALLGYVLGRTARTVLRSPSGA